jgi:hypothetical protein
MTRNRAMTPKMQLYREHELEARELNTGSQTMICI